jgi:hypothetical protein
VAALLSSGAARLYWTSFQCGAVVKMYTLYCSNSSMAAKAGLALAITSSAFLVQFLIHFPGFSC